MRALLDVNVLIALLDADHIHHTRARAWMQAHATDGWASCPITENGCVRIMSQPSYPNALPPAAILERLTAAANHPSHRFWPADVTLLDDARVDARRIHGPKQITDIYLLALAVKHAGRLVTFDGSIPLTAVEKAAPRHLVTV